MNFAETSLRTIQNRELARWAFGLPTQTPDLDDGAREPRRKPEARPPRNPADAAPKPR